MNEEALNDAYKHFVDTGYDGTLEDYKVLIGSNPEALQDSFKFFTDTGYDGTIEDFSSLLGVKKKTLQTYLVLLKKTLWSQLQKQPWKNLFLRIH